jgi:hypothetical protein
METTPRSLHSTRLTPHTQRISSGLAQVLSSPVFCLLSRGGAGRQTKFTELKEEEEAKVSTEGTEMEIELQSGVEVEFEENATGSTEIERSPQAHHSTPGQHRHPLSGQAEGTERLTHHRTASESISASLPEIDCTLQELWHHG